MKAKKTLISVFALCTAFMLTACGGKDTVSTEKPQDIQTETGTEKPQDVQTEVGTEKPQDVQAEAGTESTGASSTKLDDLYQQENQLFADHADVWNKVFGMMNKSTADPSGNYADYLAGTVESNKDSFTEDELKTLTDDIEAIRKIEEQIAEMAKEDTASGNTDQENNSEDASPFRNFSGHRDAVAGADDQNIPGAPVPDGQGDFFPIAQDTGRVGREAHQFGNGVGGVGAGAGLEVFAQCDEGKHHGPGLKI